MGCTFDASPSPQVSLTLHMFHVPNCSMHVCPSPSSLTEKQAKPIRSHFGSSRHVLGSRRELPCADGSREDLAPRHDGPPPAAGPPPAPWTEASASGGGARVPGELHTDSGPLGRVGRGPPRRGGHAAPGLRRLRLLGRRALGAHEAVRLRLRPGRCEPLLGWLPGRRPPLHLPPHAGRPRARRGAGLRSGAPCREPLVAALGRTEPPARLLPAGPPAGLAGAEVAGAGLELGALRRGALPPLTVSPGGQPVSKRARLLKVEGFQRETACPLEICASAW